MFDQKLLEFIKNNPKEVLELVKKSKHYAKYAELYRYYSQKGSFKSACFSEEGNLETIIESVIESAICNEAEKRDDFLLAIEFQEKNLSIN